MKKKSGLVAYIDLLGTSYLTEKQKSKKYEKILLNSVKIFHKSIKDSVKGKNFIIQVLSDSVFLVCDNQTEHCNQLLFCLAEIFRNCLINGVLPRCGLSDGDYKIEKTDLIDINIFGPAVTNAVKLEGRGKGARVFTTSDVAAYVDIDNCGYLFLPYEDKSTYNTFDVLNWPVLIKDYSYSPNDWPLTVNRVDDDLKNLVQTNLYIESMLRFSTKFIWNAETEDGKRHLVSTAAYISELIDRIIKDKDKKEEFQISADTFESIINIARDEETVLGHYYACWNEIFKKFLGDDTFVENIKREE